MKLSLFLLVLAVPLVAGMTYDQAVRTEGSSGAVPRQSRVPSVDTLVAGVTYDQTVRTDSFDGSVPVKSQVPLIDPPVFDIPSNLYAPPMHDARPSTFTIHVAGDRLVRVGRDNSAIFDLNARTVAVVDPKTRSYGVETLDEAQQRVQAQLKHWSIPWTTATYTAEVQKTGQTRQIEGQSADEYRVIAITLLHGNRSVGGSSVYWMVPKPPSTELAAFERRWSQECSLPFPGRPATPADGDSSVYGVMANAASKLPGYPILYVVESRPIPGAERLANSPAYDASSNSLLDQRGSREMIKPFQLLAIRVYETAFSSFIVGPIDTSLFTVPASYKEKKSLRYMPN